MIIPELIISMGIEGNSLPISGSLFKGTSEIFICTGCCFFLNFAKIRKNLSERSDFNQYYYTFGQAAKKSTPHDAT
jgi:hypothetical protein